jgi:NADPH:quinone reductase-like Zn-dependent oxidoreductase
MGFGLLKPKHQVLGADMAGLVEAIGKNVTQFKVGDEVFGSGMGGFAGYACLSENTAAHKPANLTFEQAAAVPVAGLTALQALRNQGQIQDGQHVLINGASGGVGTFAVQIAKSFGAEVTGVCSTRKVEMLRSIGSDHVIDYTQEDFTGSERRYDLIFAVGGNYPIADYKRALNADGIYVCAGGSFKQYFHALLLGPLFSMIGSKKLGSIGMAKPNPKDFHIMKELLDVGKVVPVIDKRYPLSEVPEALQYYGGGHAKGKVVITI